jgi:hypothetical protein
MALSHASLGHRPRTKWHPRSASAENASHFRRGFSIPNVPLIEINAVPVKQLAVFLMKGASAMVLLLRVNVFQYGFELAWAHRKRAISALPKNPR